MLLFLSYGTLKELSPFFAADCSNTHGVDCLTIAEQVTGFIFVFSDVDIIHHGMEISGMDDVQVLHGWAMDMGVKSVFVPSFASECVGFKDAYSVQADAAHGLWHSKVWLIVE